MCVRESERERERERGREGERERERESLTNFFDDEGDFARTLKLKNVRTTQR